MFKKEKHSYLKNHLKANKVLPVALASLVFTFGASHASAFGFGANNFFNNFNPIPHKPAFNAPKFHAPLVHKPQIHIPKPQIHIPQVHIPQVHIPKVHFPQIHIPKPQIHIPPVHIPKIHIPKPIIHKPVHKPVIHKPVHKPVIHKPIHKPVIHKPIHKPVIHKPIHKPVIHKPIHKPVIHKPVHKPVIHKPAPRPVIHKPAPKPVHKEVFVNEREKQKQEKRNNQFEDKKFIQYSLAYWQDYFEHNCPSYDELSHIDLGWEFPVQNCDLARNILNFNDIYGDKVKGNIIYTLAANLLTAKLSVQLEGKELCEDAENTKNSADDLMVEIGFQAVDAHDDDEYTLEQAYDLTDTLELYNNNELCTDDHGDDYDDDYDDNDY